MTTPFMDEGGLLCQIGKQPAHGAARITRAVYLCLLPARIPPFPLKEK